MEQTVEWFVAVTGAVIGLSHVMRSGNWAEAYRQLHHCGRPGAFVNGAPSLVTGAAVVAGHGSWAWPGAVLTAFGWLLNAKAAMCFLAPDKALQSMERGARSPRGFVFGGLLLLVVAGWACYCLWLRFATGSSSVTHPRDLCSAGFPSRSSFDFQPPNFQCASVLDEWDRSAAPAHEHISAFSVSLMCSLKFRRKEYL